MECVKKLLIIFEKKEPFSKVVSAELNLHFTKPIIFLFDLF